MNLNRIIPLIILTFTSRVDTPPAVTIESSLGSAAEQIRQLTFDGDPETFFASEKNPSRDDHFTLSFDKPAAVKSIVVMTGRPDGTDQLNMALLEISEDGKTFRQLARFSGGTARGTPKVKTIQAIRIKPSRSLQHPLVIREIVLESDSPAATFKYPIEFIVDVSDAPEMKEWAEKAARACEQAYLMINEELKSDGFKPRRVITMELKNDYDGVAATGRGRIVGSVKFFKEHPDDVGAMIHETVHNVQAYRGRNAPGWLVEGIADYVRFFKWEPVKPQPLTRSRARYDGSYRITAAFLAYLVDQHDKEFVRKLNTIIREGKYQEETFKELTGKTLQELGEEWKSTLKP